MNVFTNPISPVYSPVLPMLIKPKAKLMNLDYDMDFDFEDSIDLMNLQEVERETAHVKAGERFEWFREDTGVTMKKDYTDCKGVYRSLSGKAGGCRVKSVSFGMNIADAPSKKRCQIVVENYMKKIIIDLIVDN